MRRMEVSLKDWFLKQLAVIDMEPTVDGKRSVSNNIKYNIKSFSKKPNNIESERLRCFQDFPKEGYIKIVGLTVNVVVWKTLLFDSENKQLIESLRYSSEFSLEPLSFSVEDEKVFHILLGLKVDILPELLVDYYIFFKGVGIKRGIAEILTYLQSSLKEKCLTEIYNYLLKCAQKCENESTLNLLKDFTQSDIRTKKVKFDSSICQVIFCYLLDKMKIFLAYESIINRSQGFVKNKESFFQLLNETGVNLEIDQIGQHSDFDNFKLDVDYHNNFFIYLYSRPSSYSNNNLCDIFLRTKMSKPSTSEEEEEEEEETISTTMTTTTTTTTNTIIPAHLCVLVARSNFFSQMIKFGGRETEEFKQSGTIVIHTLSHRAVKMLKEFYYTGNIVCSISKFLDQISFENVIECIRHADQFMESDLLECCIRIVKPVLQFEEASTDQKERIRIENKFDRIFELLIKEELKPRIIKEMLDFVRKKIRYLESVLDDKKNRSTQISLNIKRERENRNNVDKYFGNTRRLARGSSKKRFVRSYGRVESKELSERKEVMELIRKLKAKLKESLEVK